jgi:hypothetical protein
MKDTLILLLIAFLLASIEPPSSSAQQEQTPTRERSAAPTGTYVPHLEPGIWDPFSSRPTNTIPLFILRLETNGTYVAESAHRRLTPDGLRLEVARGTWQWDARSREFHLQPGDFTFYIKRLPVDERNPNRLVWGSSFLERLESK